MELRAGLEERLCECGTCCYQVFAVIEDQEGVFGPQVVYEGAKYRTAHLFSHAER
jgi:hypothetical protein